MASQDLYTAGKLAKEWGVAQKDIKKTIEKLNLEPDVKKGACNYYLKETADKSTIKVKLDTCTGTLIE